MDGAWGLGTRVSGGGSRFGVSGLVWVYGLGFRV